MRNGPNLLKLARKEQCLALLAQLRNKFKTDGKIHRVFPNGEVQYLHPKDGVYPEKVNKGREAVGSVDRRIGKNPNPINVSSLAHTDPAGTRLLHLCKAASSHLIHYGSFIAWCLKLAKVGVIEGVVEHPHAVGCWLSQLLCASCSNVPEIRQLANMMYPSWQHALPSV